METVVAAASSVAPVEGLAVYQRQAISTSHLTIQQSPSSCEHPERLQAEIGIAASSALKHTSKQKEHGCTFIRNYSGSLVSSESRPHINIRYDVSSWDLVKSRSCAICILNCLITLKFDRHLGSTTAYVPNCQSRGFLDFTKSYTRRLIGYWNRAQVYLWY